MLPTLTLALAILIGPGQTAQDPTVEALVEQLNRGRLVLEHAPFKAGDDQRCFGKPPGP